MEAAEDTKPQIEAIAIERRLLGETDPVPQLAAKLTEALRTALAQAQQDYDAIYTAESTLLEQSDSWRQINEKHREAILRQLRISKASKGDTRTEQEVLESLDRISLNDWRTRKAALPQLFADARAQADRLIEPEIRHVRLPSATLRTEKDVKSWTARIEQELLDQIRKGPIAIR